MLPPCTTDYNRSSLYCLNPQGTQSLRVYHESHLKACQRVVPIGIPEPHYHFFKNLEWAYRACCHWIFESTQSRSLVDLREGHVLYEENRVLEKGDWSLGAHFSNHKCIRDLKPPRRVLELKSIFYFWNSDQRLVFIYAQTAAPLTLVWKRRKLNSSTICRLSKWTPYRDYSKLLYNRLSSLWFAGSAFWC